MRIRDEHLYHGSELRHLAEAGNDLHLALICG